MEESHIGTKTEIEDIVKGVLKLIKDGELDMDGTPEEILKREPLAELVKNIKNIKNELNVLEKVVEDTVEEDKKQKMAYFKQQCQDKIAAPVEFIERQKRQVEEELRSNKRVLNTLRQKVSDCEKQISDQQNEISQLAAKNLEQEDKLGKLEKARKSECSALQLDSRFNEFKVKLEVANRKIEEKAEELRESIASKDKMVDDLEHQVEDLKRDLEEKGNETSTLLENVENREEKLRLSNQKLRDTEQLLSEKEESFRKVEEELQKVQRELEDRRNATPVARITANNEPYHATIADIKVCIDSVKIGIDTASKKISDDCNNHENSIENISDKLQVAKEYVSEMNREKEKLQEDNKILLEELDGKKEEVLTLGEKLEAKARKEESEKTEIMDLQRTLKEQEDAYQKLNEECKVNLEDAKRKMEQMAKEFDERIESKNRIVANLDHHVEELMELLKPKA
ncbi:hypothetical protein TSUD_71740 [Trifolium subterraneum]|uniref:Uncharacterized protein n=1 Tax=Trifolium subterraneum TaxID=3900 RepID=A0A2Z6MJ27_TRISU|nr:hypothetical protein TSUD_71740 [Trifolium subterraneum]